MGNLSVIFLWSFQKVVPRAPHFYLNICANKFEQWNTKKVGFIALNFIILGTNFGRYKVKLQPPRHSFALSARWNLILLSHILKKTSPHHQFIVLLFVAFVDAHNRSLGQHQHQFLLRRASGVFAIILIWHGGIARSFSFRHSGCPKTYVECGLWITMVHILNFDRSDSDSLIQPKAPT